MTKHSLIKEWKEFGDVMGRAVPTNLEEPVDMTQPLKVYWVPGCTGCLRMKEFLTKHGVEYVSINALADKEAFNDLARIGVKRVPIAARGKHWADGQSLSEVARVAGIKLAADVKLKPAELVVRGNRVMEAAQRLVTQIPDDELGAMLPDRPRSFRQLGVHIFQIYGLFLDLLEKGKRLEFEHFLHDAPPDIVTAAQVASFGVATQRRFNCWWEKAGAEVDFTADADVYYGNSSLHEFLERTVWHSAQHTRQLQVVVQKLGKSAEGGLIAADLAGLPLPENVYDDKIKIS